MARILDQGNGFTVDLDAIDAICRRFNIIRLDLFGSAAGPEFDPSRSDVDLLVEFGPEPEGMSGFTHYFAFRDALEALFGRSVDLMSPPIKNPFVRRAVESQRRPLFAALVDAR